MYKEQKGVTMAITFGTKSSYIRGSEKDTAKAIVTGFRSQLLQTTFLTERI